MNKRSILIVLFLCTSVIVSFSQCETRVELTSCSTGVYLTLGSTYKGSCVAGDGTTGHYFTYVLEVRNRAGAPAAHKAWTFNFSGLNLPNQPCIELVRTANPGQAVNIPISASTVPAYYLKRYEFTLMFNSPFGNDLLMEKAILDARFFCL